MAPHQVNSSGLCSTCDQQTDESEVVQCIDCQEFFHGICNDQTPFGSKTFLASLKKVKSENIVMICDICRTKKENNEASCMKDQISALAATVNTLSNKLESLNQISTLADTVNILSTKFESLDKIPELAATLQSLSQDFQSYKEKQEEETEVAAQQVNVTTPPWSDSTRVQKMKSSLCIKSNGTPVNKEKLQELATNNNIQVSKTVEKDGDVYVNCPTEENREKLSELLNDEAFNGNEIVKLKSKLPTVTILNVKNFTNKEEFIEKVKKQNPRIKERIDQGSEFTIVFSKKPRDQQNRTGDVDNNFQVVARVSDDVRRVIKSENDRVYIDLVAHRVVDRFYIKRCNRCQKFGHYEKDCSNGLCCGYCHGEHKSTECEEVRPGDFEHYKCINCEGNNKPSVGHSSLWYKCPTYLELQKKLKKSISYYQSKN